METDERGRRRAYQSRVSREAGPAAAESQWRQRGLPVASLRWGNERVKRSGIADLPLHGGRVAPWLASRMATLGTAIAESVIHHYGRGISVPSQDPFWF